MKMLPPLSENGRRLLEILVAHLEEVIPRNPQTFLGYKRIHDLLGLPYIGPTYGESLKKQGLEELALWTVAHGLPGITGIVVDKSTLQPGIGYFRVFKKDEDFQWWESQISDAKAFHWDQYIKPTVATSTSNESKDPIFLIVETERSTGDSGLPSKEKYLAAFKEILPGLPSGHLNMLRAHFLAPRKTITASQLAEAAGYSGFEAANLQYGVLSHRICDALGYAPPIGNSGKPTFTFVLANAEKVALSDWKWIMHDVVADALRTCFQPLQSELDPLAPISPEEVHSPGRVIEGAKVTIVVNSYERSRKARRMCLDYWGDTCSVCETDMAVKYGVENGRCIHVHHLIPISDIGETYEIDPINDLRPVCPNCHTVLHSQDPPLRIEQLRRRLREKRTT